MASGSPADLSPHFQHSCLIRHSSGVGPAPPQRAQSRLGPLGREFSKGLGCGGQCGLWVGSPIHLQTDSSSGEGHSLRKTRHPTSTPETQRIITHPLEWTGWSSLQSKGVGECKVCPCSPKCHECTHLSSPGRWLVFFVFCSHLCSCGLK